MCCLEETSLTPPAARALTLDLSIVCSLFMLFLRLPSFVFNSLQPLFPKHPGGGWSRVIAGVYPAPSVQYPASRTASTDNETVPPQVPLESTLAKVYQNKAL